MLLAALVASIVGGVADTQTTSVVNVSIAGGQCSGVVVAPRVVVTAAHCAPAGASAGTVDTGDATIAVDRIWVDRYYDGGVDRDLAALHLTADAHVTARFAAAAPGQVTLVGFGATAPGGARGVRHAVMAAIDEIDARHLLAGGPGQTTCTGDSGGAAFDASGAVVGIVSAGNTACDAPAELVRPDAEPDLARVIAGWSGPCDARFGACDPATCDPCGFEGTCDRACSLVDLDCPLGGAAGTSCSGELDCETRDCAPVIEGAAFGAVCSAGCATVADCPAPLDTCSNGHCLYRVTPGIAGASCRVDADCRSGLCDVDAAVCTMPCADGSGCPAGLRCEPVRTTRACTLGSGCSVAGSASLPFAVVILFAIRRRRC